MNIAGNEVDGFAGYGLFVWGIMEPHIKTVENLHANLLPACSFEIRFFHGFHKKVDGHA